MIRTGGALAVLLSAVGLMMSGAEAQVSHRGPRGDVPIVVDVDALGLIEGWAAVQEGPASRSTAKPPGDLKKLLLSCPRAWSLHVTVEEEGAPSAAGGRPANGFVCQPGEAAYALPEGLSCGLRPALPPDARGANAPSSVVIAGGEREVLVTGECLGPRGGLTAAQASADLNGLAPLTMPDCPGGRSSTSFRGRLTAGGCP